jgi:hypothetical protein
MSGEEMLSIKTLIPRVLPWVNADIPSNNVMNFTFPMGCARARTKSTSAADNAKTELKPGEKFSLDADG